MYEGLVEWYATVAAGSAFEYCWKPVVTGFWRMRYMYIRTGNREVRTRPRLEDDIGQAIVSVNRTRRRATKIPLHDHRHPLPSTNYFFHPFTSNSFTKRRNSIFRIEFCIAFYILYFS